MDGPEIVLSIDIISNVVVNFVARHSTYDLSNRTYCVTFLLMTTNLRYKYHIYY